MGFGFKGLGLRVWGLGLIRGFGAQYSAQGSGLLGT